MNTQNKETKMIYVGIMDNGSGDAIIRMISHDAKDVLQCLQRIFIEWKMSGYSSKELNDILDDGGPSLDMMNKALSGNGAFIMEITSGLELYEELRNWDFKGCRKLASDDQLFVAL